MVYKIQLRNGNNDRDSSGISTDVDIETPLKSSLTNTSDSTNSLPIMINPYTGLLSVKGKLSAGKIIVFVEASDTPLNPSETRTSLAVVTIRYGYS